GRTARGGDGVVYGVEQIGRGAVVGLKAAADAKDAHRWNAPEGAVPQGVRRGRDPDTRLAPHSSEREAARPVLLGEAVDPVRGRETNARASPSRRPGVFYRFLLALGRKRVRF